MGTTEHDQKTEFEYIIDKRLKSAICFGSTLAREVLPRSGKCTSSFMRRIGASKGTSIGFCDDDAKRATSVAKMFTIGRAIRWAPDKSYQAPPRAPVAPKPTKTSVAPFDRSAERGTLFAGDKNPGPGNYEPDCRKREMKFYHSFGGKKAIVPAVDIKCMPFNDDLCSSCGIECKEEGDYWHKGNKIFMCRTCMDTVRVERNKWREKIELNAYKPVRDCSFAHYHELFENSVKLMNARQIRKKIYKESYLSGYFPFWQHRT